MDEMNNMEVIDETTEAPVKTVDFEEIDFTGKDFQNTQKMLENNAKLTDMSREISDAKAQKENILETSFKENISIDADELIQRNLDKFSTVDELKAYLGSGTKEQQKDHINEFFTDLETGEVLEVSNLDTIETENDELNFKKNLLLYFKQSDYYLEQIGVEQAKLEEAQKEFDKDMASVLNPLKDNILAYAEHLIEVSTIKEDDDKDTIKLKKAQAKKAQAIKDGYTLNNLKELVKKHPSMIKNALHDFRNERRLKELGERYQRKLNKFKISLNLYSLLNDDIKDSLEYRVLPQGDYPIGLEGFTVFFLIRYFAMGMDSPEDITFQSSVYISLTRLIKGDLDEDVAETVKGSIIEFLSLFAE